MMRYSRFEELPVWQSGLQLAKAVYGLTKAQRLRPSLRDQLERAALSVSNNIAEGFERGTTQELLTFLYIARGSAGEVRSMLHFVETLPECERLESEISNLKSLAESVSRQLRAWADSLQNSEIKGQRYLTEAVRAREKAEQDREAFLAEAEEMVRRAREEREKRAQQEGPEAPPDSPSEA
jgi:four helix bundle protein